MAHKPGHIKTGQGGKALGSTTKRGGESPKPKPEQKKKKVTNQQLLETAAELAKGLHEKSKGDPSDPNVHSSVRPGGKSGASHGAVDYKYEVNTDPLNVNLK